MKKYKIDASGKILGRLAGEIAILLRGKNEATFLPHVDVGNSVEVTNADKIKITGNKFKGKEYWRYSGYPGGIKRRTYEEVIEKKDSGEVLRKAVYGMLPGNRMRAKLMKRFTIS